MYGRILLTAVRARGLAPAPPDAGRPRRLASAVCGSEPAGAAGRQPAGRREDGEHADEDGAVLAEHAGAGQPVAAERHAEQVAPRAAGFGPPPTVGERNSRYSTVNTGHWASSGGEPGDMLVPSRW